jgi:hypothetical protein
MSRGTLYTYIIWFRVHTYAYACLTCIMTIALGTSSSITNVAAHSNATTCMKEKKKCICKTVCVRACVRLCLCMYRQEVACAAMQPSACKKNQKCLLARLCVCACVRLSTCMYIQEGACAAMQPPAQIKVCFSIRKTVFMHAYARRSQYAYLYMAHSKVAFRRCFEKVQFFALSTQYGSVWLI